MKSHIFAGVAAVPMLLFLNLGLARPADKYREVQIEGLAVTMSLEKRADRVEKAEWPDETIQLTSQSVSVNGKTIQELLLNARIYPDVESYTVVYALNPELQDLRKLSVSQIKIPKIEHGAKLEAIFGQGFQVWLTVEKEKKQQLNVSVRKLTTLTETAVNFKADRFENQAARNEFVRSLNRSTEILDGIAELVRERDGRTMPTVALEELYAETQLLITVISGKSTINTKFDQEELKAVKDVEVDLEQQSRTFKETASAGAPSTQPEKVEVSIKALKALRAVPGLRVWYVPKLSRNARQSSGELTTDNLDSPLKIMVLEAHFCFWAAKDPDATPVTNEQCQRLWLDRKIELTVK